MLEKNQFRNQFGNVMYAQHIHKYIHKRDRLMKKFIWMDECIPLGRVSDPDPVGSDVFAWIRIRIRCFCLASDPDPVLKILLIPIRFSNIIQPNKEKGNNF